MSDLLSLPAHTFSNKDCFPLGVTYPLSLVNKYFYTLLTSSDHYRNYWQTIVTSADFLYADARISCFYRKTQGQNFTLLELKVVDLRDRKIVTAARRDINTTFETIRAICTKLTQATEAAFFTQTGQEARSFFYREDLERAHKSLYRMALRDFNDIRKPGMSLDRLGLSAFLKAIMEERLPLDVVLHLIHIQTSLLTVKTHSDFLFFDFKNTALLLFTSDSVLNHPFFRESPHEILLILILLLEFIFIANNNGAEIQFKQIVLDSTSAHLSIIEHLHNNHSFTFREIIILLEWNINNQAHTLSFKYFLNFILALKYGHISSHKIKSRINKRIPLSFKHYTDEYYYCLQQGLINPRDQIALRSHILDNSLDKHHPHPLAPLYIDFLAVLKNQDEMLDPLYPHAKNILDSFLDAFILKEHVPVIEDDRPPGIQSYMNTVPLQWHIREELTVKSLCAFYHLIKQKLQAAIDCTPPFPNKDIFTTQFMLKKKSLYVLMSSTMHTFVETQSDETDQFQSFPKTTHAFIKMLDSVLSDIFTSELTKHFAQAHLGQAPQKSTLDFRELNNHRRITAHIAPILYTKHHPFRTKATIVDVSFDATIETLSGLIESFVTDAVPKLEQLAHNQADIIQLPTNMLIHHYHNYLIYYFYNLDQNGLEIVLSIHRTLMESINDGSFFTLYVTYIVYLQKHLGIQKMLDVGSTRLHLLLITFIKLQHCLKHGKIEAKHFEEVVTLLDIHRKHTVTSNFIDLEKMIYDFLKEDIFLDLFYDRKKSTDWVHHHINIINIFFPIQIEETNSDMEFEDLPLHEEFEE